MLYTIFLFSSVTILIIIFTEYLPIESQLGNDASAMVKLRMVLSQALRTIKSNLRPKASPSLRLKGPCSGFCDQNQKIPSFGDWGGWERWGSLRELASCPVWSGLSPASLSRGGVGNKKSTGFHQKILTEPVFSHIKSVLTTTVGCYHRWVIMSIKCLVTMCYTWYMIHKWFYSLTTFLNLDLVVLRFSHFPQLKNLHAVRKSLFKVHQLFCADFRSWAWEIRVGQRKGGLPNRTRHPSPLPLTQM